MVSVHRVASVTHSYDTIDRDGGLLSVVNDSLCATRTYSDFQEKNMITVYAVGGILSGARRENGYRWFVILQEDTM